MSLKTTELFRWSYLNRPSCMLMDVGAKEYPIWISICKSILLIPYCKKKNRKITDVIKQYTDIFRKDIWYNEIRQIETINMYTTMHGHVNVGIWTISNIKYNSNEYL